MFLIDIPVTWNVSLYLYIARALIKTCFHIEIKLYKTYFRILYLISKRPVVD